MNLFPYSEERQIQNEMIKSVKECLEQKKNLIVHAPTGLGKTAAALVPALEYAIEHDKTVFFLTSRHTQHRIAVDTLASIREKHKDKEEFAITDIIGKRWMCAQPKIEMLGSKEFREYCKTVRENYTCQYYVETRSKSNKPTAHAEDTVKKISKKPLQVEELNALVKTEKMCPYEIATILAKKSRVVVADYFYMFNSSIRNTFLRKIERALEDVIIIVDEGHNLPDRVREMLTEKLNSYMLERALKEAKKYKFDTILQYIVDIQDILNRLGDGVRDEKKVSKDDFNSGLNKIGEREEIIHNMMLAAEEIRDKQRISFVGSVAGFIMRWQDSDEGYARMIQASLYHGKPSLSLVYRCLDPSLESGPITKEAHSTIIMSGTLTPTTMYKDLLGVEAEEKEFKSPFPEENKLMLIVPKTTTKYTSRNEDQYKQIAIETSKLCEAIPGNVAVFFPSYYIRDKVYTHFFDRTSKTIFLEENGMTKEQKQEMLEKFKGYSKIGAVLLGVVAANFSEGIDLPGDFLKGVVVVGLPLSRPDLETKELIDYFDGKYSKGWDYGYVLPAFSKTLQAAGRCIRSETDKGVIVFLDERYAWQSYTRCFPKEASLKITKDYEKEIKEFF